MPGEGELAQASGGWGDRGLRHSRWGRAGPGEGDVGRGERAGEGAGQSRAQGACTPRTRLPRFSEDLSISWRAMALVLPWQRLGCDPLLLTSPSPHKQSGRTHRPSRSCLFGSQSCEMQQ